MNTKIIKSDVLIIGCGAAGAMAAIECKKNRVTTIIVEKGKAFYSGCTVMAPGGMAGVNPAWSMKGDNIKQHFDDTMKAGTYLNNHELVEIFANKAGIVIEELERMGAFWEKDSSNKKNQLRMGGGHRYPRSVFLEDHIGAEIMHTLYSQVIKKEIPICENTVILEIISDQNIIFGAVGLDLITLEIIFFDCKAIILATGGAGQLFMQTDNSLSSTGDGEKLALVAGASLIDIEFIQFYPLGFLFPPSLKGKIAGMLYYSKLRNSDHIRFMKNYDPKNMELSTRDIICQAIYQEISIGKGTSSGGVYCDMTYHPDGFIAQAIPQFYQTYKSIGIDIRKDFLEVAPTAHFLMGGIQVNSNWETKIQGLLGAGEVCGGIHGSNRLTQNALSEALVSGKISAKRAVEISKMGGKKITNKMIDEKVDYFKMEYEQGDNKINQMAIRKEIQQVMWDNLGIIRNREGILKSINKIEAIDYHIKHSKCTLKNNIFNRELLLCIENKSLISFAKCICVAALERKESRGSHYRSDYPIKDDKGWFKNIIIEKADGEIQVKYNKINFDFITEE